MKLSELLLKRSRLIVSDDHSVTRKIFTAIRNVEATFPEIDPMTSERDPEIVARVMLERVLAGNWSDCTVSDIAAAVRVIFHKHSRDQPHLAPLRDFLLQQLAVTPHASLLKAALDIHVATFEEGNVHTIALADALKPRVDSLPIRSRQFLKVLPEALDGAGGASALGRRMVEAKSVRATFEELPAIPSGGLIDEASAAFVASLAPRMADQSAAHRVLDWFAPEGETSREVGANRAIDALMAPWRKKEPPAEWKQTLLDRLVAAFDDTRVTPGGAWSQVRPETRETFIRWQTGATLDAFLDIVTKAEKMHMWADRMPFWRDLYREGHIQDACVALSPDAQVIARKVEDRSGKASIGRYGRQISGGEDKIKSLLIMKINGKTVVEGSYNFQVHVFPTNHPETPILHRGRYDCVQIRDALPARGPDKKVHDRGGKWKTFVREKTGCLR